MNDPQEAALNSYNQHFDAEQYEGIAGLLASNLYVERDDPRVVAALDLLIDTTLRIVWFSAARGELASVRRLLSDRTAFSSSLSMRSYTICAASLRTTCALMILNARQKPYS